MKVIARHRHAPLVALSDGSVIDTDELEVVGHGDVSGANWEFGLSDPDARWVEIANADTASLSVTEKSPSAGIRAFRAPGSVKQHLKISGVDTPLASGQGLTLEQLEQLLEHEHVHGPALDWIIATLNKHQVDPDEEKQQALFDSAEPELDYGVIDAATDGMQGGEYPDEIIASISNPVPGRYASVVYFALIEDDDTKSVQDLVALVKTQQGAAEAFTYQGAKKGWTQDPKLVQQLTSTNPPPIKQLQDWQTDSILKQIDATDAPVTPVTAGAAELLQSGVIWGPDNKRILAIVAASSVSNSAKGHAEGAERLRQYWEHGEGAAKIKWAPNSGAWKRCVRHLSKYLGTRSRGYCTLRMHDVLGIWPGSRENGGHGWQHHG